MKSLHRRKGRRPRAELQIGVKGWKRTRRATLRGKAGDLRSSMVPGGWRLEEMGLILQPGRQTRGDL